MNETDCLEGATHITVYAFSALFESRGLASRSITAHSPGRESVQADRKISSFPQHSSKCPPLSASLDDLTAEIVKKQQTRKRAECAVF